jgi:hypothetical protein
MSNPSLKVHVKPKSYWVGLSQMEEQQIQNIKSLLKKDNVIDLGIIGLNKKMIETWVRKVDTYMFGLTPTLNDSFCFR